MNCKNKPVLILSLFLVCLTLTGCSQRQIKGSLLGPIYSISKIDFIHILVKDYKDLTPSVQNQVDITFSLKKAQSDEATEMFNISAKITNNSDKTVKFNLARFTMIGAGAGNEPHTTLKKEIIVQKHSAITIKKLFNNATEQTVVAGGLFQYAGKSIATTDFGPSNEVTKNSLQSVSSSTIASVEKNEKKLTKAYPKSNNSSTTVSSSSSNSQTQHRKLTANEIGNLYVKQLRIHHYLNNRYVEIIVLKNASTGGYTFTAPSQPRIKTYILQVTMNNKTNLQPILVNRPQDATLMNPLDPERAQSAFDFEASSFDAVYSNNKRIN